MNYIEYSLILISTITGCVSVFAFASLKKHDKTVLLAKSRLNGIKVLICKALIDPNISHDESF